MSISAGTLTLDMAMNLSRLQQDIASAKLTVGEGMESIKKAAENAKPALELIRVGVSAADKPNRKTRRSRRKVARKRVRAKTK